MHRNKRNTWGVNMTSRCTWLSTSVTSEKRMFRCKPLAAPLPWCNDSFAFCSRSAGPSTRAKAGQALNVSRAQSLNMSISLSDVALRMSREPCALPHQRKCLRALECSINTSPTEAGGFKSSTDTSGVSITAQSPWPDSITGSPCSCASVPTPAKDQASPSGACLSRRPCRQAASM